MNLFAVNEADVNGSIEVWSWYGDAELAVNCQGELSAGLTIAGDASVVLEGALEPSLRVTPNLDGSQVLLSSECEAIFGRSIEGQASITLSALGEGVRWTFGESNSGIVFELDGEAVVVSPASGNFTISVGTWMDGTVSTVAFGDGFAGIVLSGYLTPRYARPGYLSSDTEVVIASVADPYIVISGPVASAAIAFYADGGARLGEKLCLEGDAWLDIFARGELGGLHYVWLDGDAVLLFDVNMSQAGIPQTPTDYVPAPAARTITVSREARSMAVAREDRRV